MDKYYNDLLNTTTYTTYTLILFLFIVGGCSNPSDSRDRNTITQLEIEGVNINDDSLRVMIIHLIIDSAGVLMDRCLIEAKQGIGKNLIEEKYRPVLVELQNDLNTGIREMQMSYMKQKRTEEEFIEFLNQFDLQKLKTKSDSIESLLACTPVSLLYP